MSRVNWRHTHRVNFKILVLVLGLAAALLGVGLTKPTDDRTFRIERKDQGFPLPDRYPTGDFQVQMRLKLTQPGSILDTVGIDAAPTGSWSVAATADGHIAFNLWDGKSWSQLQSNVSLAWGQESLVTIQRSRGVVTLLVNASWTRQTLATPLSGKPLYVGDYPPDEHWGAGYNIHQAAIGQIDVLYVGAPKLYSPSFSDYSRRIWDDRGALSPQERQRLETALRTLKEKKGLDVAVAFVKGKDADEGTKILDAFSHHLRADGIVPETYAIFGYIGDSVRLFHRTPQFDSLMTWEAIKGIWNKQSADNSQSVGIAMTLAEMSGETNPVKQTEPQIQPEIKEKKTVIGASGGSVSAGPVTVDIPSGALLKEDTIVVRQGAATIFGEAGVSINFEHESQTLLKPASVVFPIPAGADPQKLVAVRSIGPNSWVTMPTTIDPVKGVLVAKTNHFCDAVLIDLGRTKAKFVGSVAGGVSGTILLAATGLAPTTSGVSVLVAVPFLVVGWLAGGTAYDAAQREGLAGPFPSPGFSLFWDPRLTNSGPYISFLTDKNNGNFIGPAIDSRSKGQTFIGPATSAPRSTMTYSANGREFEVATADISELKVPLSVLGVAGELDVARSFYTYLGIDTPPITTTYIYDRLGKSKDQAKESNSGEWDGKILQINSKSLNPEPPNTVDSRSASCHEYWHAVSTHNRFSEMWPGAEEAIAVSMESLVWASPAGTSDDKLMEDFMKLHAWITCTPVLRSGLFNVGRDEAADTRGYKQWPLLKYIYHKLGKDALAELIRGKMSPARLDEAVVGFALAGLISDQVVADPSPIADHPVFRSAITRTGFAKPSLIEDAESSLLKFGETDRPKASRGSINAYNVIVPARSADAPASPIVIRRRAISRESFPILERVYASKPGSGAVPQPSLGEIKTDQTAVALPEAWDAPGHMAVMFVGSVATSPLMPPTPPSNPILIYRLSPPTNVKAEHLAAANGTDAKTRFTWTLPELGGSMSPRDAIASYRLYGRKSGGAAVLLAEIVLDGAHESAWYAAPASAIKMDPNARQIALPISRTKVLGFDEFAMSSIDGLMKRDGKPLESPVGWSGGSNFLAALDKANVLYFYAGLNFVADSTSQRDDNPPRTQVVNYPISGAVYAPDAWSFTSTEFKGGTLKIENGRFEYKFQGSIKVTANDPLGALSAHNPSWPFNMGSAFDGPTTISLIGQIGSDGRLGNAALKIEHAQFGCTISFGDLVPTVAKINGAEIEIKYEVKGPEATAKSSGHSAWMRWNYPNGYSELRMTKFLSMQGITLTFTRSGEK